MNHDFDPYFKWLGIPPEEQPPNYYRLLGIPLFTSDLEVIDNAVDQRMAHLRTFQLGPRAPLCQNLLNDVAMVRGCLQDPDQKGAYDSALQLQLAYHPPHVQHAVEAPSATPPVAPPLAPQGLSRPAPRQSNSLLGSLFAQVLGGLGGLALGYLFICWLGPQYDFLKLRRFFIGKEQPVTQLVPPVIGRPNQITPPPLPPTPTVIPAPQKSPEKSPAPQPAPVPTRPTVVVPPVVVPPAVVPVPVPAKSPAEQKQAWLKEREEALAAGDLTAALAAVQKLSQFDRKEVPAAQAEFLAGLHAPPDGNLSLAEITTALVQLLEQAAAEGNVALVGKYANPALTAARKAQDRDLERRATALVLKTR